MSKKLVNPKDLVGEKWSFFTTAGVFSGTITDSTPLENGGYGISMVDVIYRSHGSFLTQMNLPECVVYSRHITVSTPYIEPVTVRGDD